MDNQGSSSCLTFENFRRAVSEISGVSSNRIERNSDLIGLGIDSIRLMRLAGWLRKQGLPIRFSELSSKQTVGEWWSLVQSAQRELASSKRECPLESIQMDEGQPFDLAVMQHAFWVGRVKGQELSGVSAHFYNEFDADNKDVPGVDPQRLENAIRELFERHGMLRMRVTEDGRQYIDRKPAWNGLCIHDLRGFSAEERVERLQSIRDELSHRIMDVSAGEVFDIQLSLLDEGATRMHVSLDMMAADAMSLRRLLNDLSILYLWEHPELPSLTYSYPMYLAERAKSRQIAREQAAGWWRGKLSSLSGPPSLPLLREEEAGGRPTVTRRHFWLSPEQKETAFALSHRHGVTPAVMFATAFAEVVDRWSETDRFFLNLPVFDREPLHDDVEYLVGDFSSSVLVDIDMSGSPAFSKRASRVQSLMHEAIGHAEYTGVEVLRDLTRAANGDTVLAPVVFTSALELGELFAPEVQQVFGRPSWIISQGPQVWLDAQVTELDGGILVNWDARDSVFPEGVLDAMFSAFEDVVTRLLREEDAWEKPIDLPLPLDQKKIRDCINNTKAVFDKAPLHERFFLIADSHPDLTAVIWDCEGDIGSLSYGQLAFEAKRVSAMLASKGIGKGSRVGITLPKGPEQIVAVLGVLATGASYVPSGIDVPEIRRLKVFESACVDAVITEGSGIDLSWSPSLDVFNLADAADFCPVDEIERIDPEDEMYVLFTSGSTGEPKGVKVPHRAVANTICAVQKVFDIGQRDRTIALSALDFDLSVYDMFAFLAVGGSIVSLRESQRRDALAWANLIEKYEVTVVSCVPALLDMLLVAGSEHLPRSVLRLVMLGGDWVTVDLPDRLRFLVPECRFAGLGGMTEAAIHATICEVEEVCSSWNSVPYGRPLSNMRCRVVDSHGRDCPDWVQGELWVSGAGVALGYDRDPQKTAQRFVEYDSSIWYRTGDMARYWPDGSLEFMGRADDQVKIRGHRIELGEIEAQLASHPSVKSAVAVVVEVVARQVAATVILNKDVGIDELRRWLADRLPSYMVPERVKKFDSFPVTSNGKIDRSAIRRVLSEGETFSGDYEAPVGSVEQTVADLWCDLLGVDRVSRGDNFFALGGDSLLATRFMRRLREAGMSGALSALFEAPDLRGFSGSISVQREERETVVSIAHRSEERFEPFPLTDVQRAYWIGRDPKLPLGGISPSYYLELEGSNIDLEKLEIAWNCLVKRHDMLRAIVLDDGMQKVLPEVPDFNFDIVEAGSDPINLFVEKMRDELAWGEFDASSWPLFKIRVILYGDKLEKPKCRIGISLDSIAFDARSIMIIFSEWESLYLGAIELPPLEMTFRDYVTQVALPSPDCSEASLSYWIERIDGMAPAPQLPLVSDLSSSKTPRFYRHSAIVEAAIWKSICDRAQKIGVTPTAVLLAVYAEILAQWSGRSDMTINLTLFDRDERYRGIGDVVGDFSSLMLVECNAEGSKCFEKSVRAVQKRLWNDLDHRQVSGVRVLREIARKRGLAVHMMPVVFTSVLGLGPDASMEFSEKFPQPLCGLTQTPQVYLDLKVSQTSKGLLIDWDSVDDLFEKDMSKAMFEAYVELVRRLADVDWQRGVASSIPRSQRIVRERVNNTSGEVADSLLHEGFFKWASEEPDRIALVFEGGRMTYGELSRRALQVAAWMIDQGVTPGDTVAIDLPKGPDQIISLFGVLAAGATYLPIGRDLPPRRKAKLLSDGRAVLLVEDVAPSKGFPPLPAPKCADSSQTAYVIFTSGTTGEPKGVEISHMSAMNTIGDINERFNLGSDDRALAVSGIEFDLSVYDVFGLLGSGGSIVLIDEEERRDAQRWLELAHEHSITVWNTVPALLEMLVTVAETESGLPASLRLAMVSGDWVPLDLPSRVGALAPQCKFVSLGGATEAAIWSNAFCVDKIDPSWTSIPYGFPLKNQCFRVVDEKGRDCPDWVKGELWIGGLGVAQGYRGDSARTEEKFLLLDGARWYRTGDMGRYWPDGTLEFCGRLDTQVKIRGHRIELGEIEAALASYPGVDRGICVAPGERERRWLAAFVQGVDDLDKLKSFLSETLAPYAVPRLIVEVDSFPLTSNGKIDRSALAQNARFLPNSQIVEPPAAAGSNRNLPLSDMEKQVADIWGEILGVDSICKDDDFFSLGGDSLLATRLVSRLRKEGVAGAELANLFLAPVLSDFAATLSAGRAVFQAEVLPDPHALYEPFDLTDVQQAYWVGRDQNLPLGGISAQFYVEYEFNSLDVERLEDCWNRLIQRHEMLRSVVDAEGHQRILTDVPRYKIEVTRIVSDSDIALASYRRKISRKAFDSSVWPLFDVRVFHLGDDSIRLCVALDNLMVDGLSALTLFDEWRELYLYPQTELSKIGLTFRDYVVQSEPSPERLESARSYWDERLASIPLAPMLPLRVDPGEVGLPQFAHREMMINEEMWRDITEKAAQCGVTPAVALLTCYADVIGRRSASHEFTLNLTLFDRRPVHPDIDHVVGDFTSLLLVSCHLGEAGEDWPTRARRIQEQLWRDLDHREMSGVAVMRELSRMRGTSAGSMPIVFTSMLGVGKDILRRLRWPDYTRSQTPQVWLDHQVVECQEGVLLSWDSVDEIFPEGLVDEMFNEYRMGVMQLASESWKSTLSDVCGKTSLDDFAPREPLSKKSLFDYRFEPPSTEMEKVVAGLWSEILEVPEVGRGDGFFALGGDSLLATRLVARLRGRGISGAKLSRLLEGPSLADFSSTLSFGGMASQLGVSEDIEHRFDPFPLTEVQEAYWIGRSSDFMLGGIPTLFGVERLAEESELPCLEEAWNKLVRRHEMLRAIIQPDGRQRILRDVPYYRISMVDAKGDDSEEEKLSAIRGEMKLSTLDCSSWPLFDIRMVKTAEEARLIAVFDTMIVDGSSMLTLLAEWNELVESPHRELCPLGLSFRDYVTQIEPDPGRLAESERYWFDRVDSLAPAPALPLVVDPGLVGKPSFRRLEHRLNPDDWQAITEKAKKTGCNSFGGASCLLC